MSKHTKETTTFTQWIRMLDKMAHDQYGFDINGMADSWRELYEDDYTPREALDEDTYAGL